MKNINFKIQISIPQRKLHSILQRVFSTSHYTINTVFNTPTHWANVYKVTLDKGALYQPWDKTYIVRILNPAHSTLEERQKEIQLTQKMSELGIAPKMYYSNPHMGVMVMEYIATQSMGEGKAEVLLATLAQKLKKLHAMDPTPYRSFGSEKLEGLFARVKTAIKPEPNFLNPGRMKSSKFALLDQSLKAYTALKNMLDQDNHHSVGLCHLDLNKTNLLFDGEQTWIIDWDIADQGDIYFDLATVINTLKLIPTQEKLFLHAYFEKKLNEAQTARLYVFKQLCYLRYAITTFGLCTSYKTLPAPQGLLENLKPVFVFPDTSAEHISKSIALYMLALAFYKEAKTNMAGAEFAQALKILPHTFQEPLHEHLKSFCDY